MPGSSRYSTWQQMRMAAGYGFVGGLAGSLFAVLVMHLGWFR